MKKSVIVLVCCICFGAFALSGCSFVKTVKEKPEEVPEVIYEHGDGSADNPYIISSSKQLDSVRLNLGASYKLANDIDMDDFVFKPIGTESEPFTGNFDGAGYAIRYLTFNSKKHSKGIPYLGTFGYLRGASVKNLCIEKFDTNVSCDIEGILAGYAGSETIIENCRVSGGGRYYGDVNGGIVGKLASRSQILNSYADILISSGEICGGIVGEVAESTVSGCKAVGTLYCEEYNYSLNGKSISGGLVGSLKSGTVTNCYSLVAIADKDTGWDFGSWGIGGGLFGTLTGGKVSFCYAGGELTGKNKPGAIYATNSGATIENVINHYDGTGVSYAYSGGKKVDSDGNVIAPDGILVYTSEQMTDSTNFADWNKEVWDIKDGEYPELKHFTKA